MKHGFLNHNKVVPLSTPGDATTSAVNSDWIGLAAGAGVVITVIVTEGRSGAQDDNTITLRQATAAAGTGAKAFVPRRAYVRSSATSLILAASADPTVIEAADGAIDIHVDGDVSSIIDIEVDASELDVNNNFTHLQARLSGVGSSSTTVTIVGVATGLFHVTNPRHQADVLA